MNEQDNNMICHVCQKTFSSVSTKNRHLRSIHHEDVERKPANTVHIKCPVCSEKDKISFGSHDLLISHLENIHSLNIKTSFHNFSTMDEFESWKARNSESVEYVIHSSRVEPSSNTKRIYYICNRSDYKGFVSKCTQRSAKTGGSIRISGWCPSRICVKICNSEITVKFTETHVGHDYKLGCKQLTESQQQMIANKLKAGVPKDRVLEDAKEMENKKVELKREEPSSRSHYENDVQNFIEENDVSTPNLSDPSRKREITYERTCMLLKLLNDDSFYKISRSVEKIYGEEVNACKRKRKIDKQLYYPSKK